MSGFANRSEGESSGQGGASRTTSTGKPTKRVKLSVARTVLPKGHSLKVVRSPFQPGGLSSGSLPSFTPSPLLAKMQNFLPKMKDANDALSESLQREDPNKFNVEYISDSEKGHVEMNIALVPEDACNSLEGGVLGSNSTPSASSGSDLFLQSNGSLPSSCSVQTSHQAKKIIEIVPDSNPSIAVSVIIPVYNGMPYLEECLQSIFVQTYDPKWIEVSVYDDASTDGSLAALLRWETKFKSKGFSFVCSSSANFAEGSCDKNRGAGYAKNRAVEQSNGSLLCFVDCDDTMMPTRIEKQVRRFCNYNADKVTKPLINKNLLLGTGFIRSPANATERYTNWCNGMTEEQLYLHQYRELTLIQPTWCLCREWFDKVGGYKEQDVGAPEPFPSDLDFFHRHLDLDGKLGKVNEHLIMYRYLKTGLSWKISRRVLLQVKSKAFERRILNINRSSRPNGFKHEKWTRGFTIWGNGRDGKDFFKSLSPESRALVTCFADIDPAKIKRGYYNPNLNVRLPVVHFTEAAPPVAICVAMDRGGQLERNVQAMKWVEGIDYFHMV
jgi:glycosyltransferase involved in cell wall biosynthesis